MNCRDPLPPAFLDWLDQVQQQLVHLECENMGVGGGSCRGVAGDLWRLRRECDVLNRCLVILVESGQLRQGQRNRMSTLLGDLCWLLEVSPVASPVIARQCVRIARDRIQSEAQDFPDIPNRTALRSIHSCAA